jgi:hypothetical protein
MQPLVKRSLLVVAAPLALAAVIGGSVAFASASGGDDATSARPSHSWHEQTAPSPDGGARHHDCPNMGGDSGSGTQSTDTASPGQV